MDSSSNHSLQPNENNKGGKGSRWGMFAAANGFMGSLRKKGTDSELLNSLRDPRVTVSTNNLDTREEIPTLGRVGSQDSMSSPMLRRLAGDSISPHHGQKRGSLMDMFKEMTSPTSASPIGSSGDETFNFIIPGVPKTYVSIEFKNCIVGDIAFQNHESIGSCISNILDNFEWVRNNGAVSSDPNDYRLCKVDTKTPGVFIWFDLAATVESCRLKDRDLVKMINVQDIRQILIDLPALGKQHGFEVAFDVLTKDVIAKLKEQEAQLGGNIAYGLYWPSRGIWLEDNKNLACYDLNQQTIELRELAEAFLLRVYLPDVEVKFTLRVLPTFCGSDIIQMVRTQIHSRNLSTGGKFGQYGLFIPPRSQWLALDKTLKEENAILTMTEEVHFTLHYKTLTVRLPTIWNGGKMTEQAPIHFLADTSATIFDVIQCASLHDGFCEEEPHGLYTTTGDRLKDEENVWSIFKDNEDAVVVLKPLGKKLKVITNRDQNCIPMEAEVDFAKPLCELIPFFCRRFGIRRPGWGLGVDEFEGFASKDGTFMLASELSLHEQRVDPGAIVCLRWRTPSSTPFAAGFRIPPRVLPNSGLSSGVNIWDETETNNIQYTTDAVPVVHSATLNKLVEKLTDENGSGTNGYFDFVRVFLLTYESFTTPAAFLKKLIERYHVPRLQPVSSEQHEKSRATIQLRVCNVLLQWLKKHGNDFALNDGLEEELKGFLENVLAEDNPSMARQIAKIMSKMQDAPTKIEIKHSVPAPIPKLPKSPTDRTNLLSYPDEEIARQFTIVDFALFTAIKPTEFLNQRWAKKDATKTAPNIITLTRRFNATASWVAATILDQPTPQARALAITKLIHVAQELLILNNFSSLTAFIAGLNKSPIIRLKQSWKELSAKSTKKIKELEILMTAENSYRNYRMALKAVNPPCIPYIGVYLADLTFMEDGNPDTVEHRINFSKRTLIANVIHEVQQYQSTPYNLKAVDEAQAVIASFQDHTEAREKALYSKSLEREPRVAQ